LRERRFGSASGVELNTPDEVVRQHAQPLPWSASKDRLKPRMYRE
jgi:hypothetical protein